MVALLQAMVCKVSLFKLISFIVMQFQSHACPIGIDSSVFGPSRLMTATDVPGGPYMGCSLCGETAYHLKCRVGGLQDAEHFPSLACFLLDVLSDVISSTFPL